MLKRKHDEDVIDLLDEDGPVAKKRWNNIFSQESYGEEIEDDDRMVVEEDEEGDEDINDIEQKLRNIPVYQQKAVQKLFTDAENDFPKDIVIQFVVNYCQRHPAQKAVGKIVTQIKKFLKESPDILFGSPSQQVDISLLEEDNSQVEMLIDENGEGTFFSPKLRPLDEILNIYPNAKRSYVEQLLKENNDDYIQVIEAMTEKGYEKEENIQLKKKKIEEKYDFKSSSWETSVGYRQDALIELMNNFPFLSTTSLPKIFAEKKHHYYHTLQAIEEVTGIKAILDYYDRFHVPVLVDLLGTPAKDKKKRGAAAVVAASSSSSSSNQPLLPTIITEGCLKYQKTDIDLINSRIQSKKNDLVIPWKTRQNIKNLPKPSNHLDEVLSCEIEFLQNERTKALLDQDYEIAAKINQELAMEDNALYECQCCYDNEFSFEEIIQCTEGDLFCIECLQRYIESMVFGGTKIAYPLKCMNSINKCPGFFTEVMIEKALQKTPKILAKYNETMFHDNLMKSELSLVSCYHCQSQYEMADDSGNVLHCPSCHASTCRLCGEESHIPLKCSEVEKKSQTEKRLKIEEAMAEARIRECPTCHKRFFKTEGCNKMTCTCGTMICYICRAKIDKERYAHFCQTPHCNHQSCQKCLLYTDAVEDDRRAMLEAGLKAIKETADGEGGEEGGGDRGEGNGPVNSKDKANQKKEAAGDLKVRNNLSFLSVHRDCYHLILCRRSWTSCWREGRRDCSRKMERSLRRRSRQLLRACQRCLTLSPGPRASTDSTWPP